MQSKMKVEVCSTKDGSAKDLYRGLKKIQTDMDGKAYAILALRFQPVLPSSRSQRLRRAYSTPEQKIAP